MGTRESTIDSVITRAKNFFFMGLLLFIRPFAFESPIVVGCKPTTKGYTLLFFCNIAIAAIRLPEHISSLAVSYVIIVPHGRRTVQAFAWRRSGIFCVTSRLYPPLHLSFQQKCPCVGFLFGSRTGAGGVKIPPGAGRSGAAAVGPGCAAPPGSAPVRGWPWSRHGGL